MSRLDLGCYEFQTRVGRHAGCCSRSPGSGIGFFGWGALAHIYVPAGSVDDYKGATGWSAKASIIEAIPGGGETAVDNIQIDKAQGTKVLRNGMLLIERNGKLYNATGTEVK